MRSTTVTSPNTCCGPAPPPSSPSPNNGRVSLFVETNPNYSLDRGGKASALTSNTKSGNYKALSFPFVSNASPAEGAAARGGNIRKITGFRKSRQRGSGLDGDNRPERHSQTGRRTGADKKWKPDKNDGCQETTAEGRARHARGERERCKELI